MPTSDEGCSHPVEEGFMARTVWFITGIARGLGRSLAKAAMDRGDLVIGTTRDGTPPGGLKGGNLTILPMELTDGHQVASTVAAAQDVHGRLDRIVNHAGYGLLGPIEAAAPDDVAHTFAVNFFGPLHVMQAALPRLREQRRGHIINISSISGIAPTPGSGVYAAAKFALEGLSQSLAQEVAPFGIWVTLVEPGPLRTDFLSKASVRWTAPSIDDHAAVSGNAGDGLSSKNRRRLVDPDLAAAAILQAVEADEPPLNLVLGSDACDRAMARLNRFEEDLMRWESLSLSADFPF
jgi:NAD(P)-dependent dehydrogenase (short-subunit alcohol dehydrogenase family)